MTICIRRTNISDANGIARVHIDTWRTAYHGILSDEFLSNLSYDTSRRNWETTHLPHSQNAVYVAEDETKRVVGFASCRPDRDAVNDYIQFTRHGREVPDRLSEFLREQGLLEDCDLSGYNDCERFLFRTEGTLRDVNGENIGERHIWYCDCGQRHVFHASTNAWTL
jgi:hypothetical protein